MDGKCEVATGSDTLCNRDAAGVCGRPGGIPDTAPPPAGGCAAVCVSFGITNAVD
jgi:hypothetical protein